MQNPPRNQRRSIRLKGYDYSHKGAYFVTICTKHRQCLFGVIRDDQMQLNPAGEAAQKCWLAIPEHFPHIALDHFVVMPNHIHAVLFIAENAGINLPLSGEFRSPKRTIGSVVRGFKIGVVKHLREIGMNAEVWQRNYYEHIVRDEDALDRIREYIVANPKSWRFDRENPNCENPQNSTNDYVDGIQ